MAVKGKNT